MFIFVEKLTGDLSIPLLSMSQLAFNKQLRSKENKKQQKLTNFRVHINVLSILTSKILIDEKLTENARLRTEM